MRVDTKEITVSGKFVKIARLEEEWYEDIDDPMSLISKLKNSNVKADIFTFWQRLPDIEPKFNYYMEWDPIAALPIKSYDYWHKKQINNNAKRAVKKAEKIGVIVKESSYEDEFIRGMTEIFNETPIRQGRPFWHYGKDFDTVKQEFSKNLFREDLIGAYYNDELIGFIMLAYAGKYALTGQIISKIKHRNKYPNNALIAKAVEICLKKKISYLVYLKWNRGSLTEFKRRNGFQKFDLPRYYAPITLKGTIALKLKLHHGFIAKLPNNMKDQLKNLRKYWYSRK
jgi:hypothetical protein